MKSPGEMILYFGWCHLVKISPELTLPVLRLTLGWIYALKCSACNELLNNSTGVELYDDLENQIYPMANLFVGDELVHVGRIRKDLDNPNGLSLWIVADQLMKGAAYNSVDIGLKMIEMDLI